MTSVVTTPKYAKQLIKFLCGWSCANEYVMVNYRFIGWCKEGRCDKVWIAIQLRKHNFDTDECGKVLTLWGKRKGSLQTKIVDDDQDLYKLILKKRKKGYEQYSTEYLGKVYPEFKADLEKQYIWSTLAL